MASPLTNLAKHYSQRYGEEVRSRDNLRQLYDKYVREREASILDAVAATAAIDAIFFSDQINSGAITPQMQEAWEFGLPNMAIEQLNGQSPE